MTQHPSKFEKMSYQAPGIDDLVSELYKDFDKCGRTQNTFMQRAAMAGVKNLQTNSYRKDSPLR